MIVGFTGTQHGLTSLQREALRQYLTALRMREFHHGDCIGADAVAHWMIVHKVDVIIHPSDSNEKRAFCKGAVRILEPRPPLVRNTDIVKAIDRFGHLVGCPKNNFEEIRSGTWATIRTAWRLGKKVTIIWPDGRVQQDARQKTITSD